MKVLEIQPTPNPNAVKIMLSERITEQPLSFFNADAGKDHPLASRLFAIPGVASLLILHDFVTVSKSPEAVWRELTPAVKRVLAEWQKDVV
ncbi:MAG: NifU N-terminal domain-containing protein [Burkholderiales bacterium]|nr:NifU N-terminal domain-containing protein [Phycisphaerae bacterium]